MKRLNSKGIFGPWMSKLIDHRLAYIERRDGKLPASEPETPERQLLADRTLAAYEWAEKTVEANIRGFSFTFNVCYDEEGAAEVIARLYESGVVCFRGDVQEFNPTTPFKHPKSNKATMQFAD